MRNLDRGFMDLDVMLITTRVPKQVTFIAKVPLKYQIFIDKKMKDHNVFSIDYERKHGVYLLDGFGQKTLLDRNKIGEIEFQGKNKSAKLMDIRGMQYLRRDYGEILQESQE